MGKKLCSREGCENGVSWGGVCVAHGATKKRCRHKGCTNQAQNGRVSLTHDAKITRCSHKGCKGYSRKGGLCQRHGKKTVATSRGEVKHHPQPSEGFEATTVGGIARRVGGFGVNNLQKNISSATPRQSPSPGPSATTTDYSHEEELGAWIYRAWRCNARPFGNSINKVSSSLPSSRTCESLHRAATHQSNIMGGEGGGGGGGTTSGNSVGLGSSNHCPMFRGGYALAHEAAHADHYCNWEGKQSRKSKIKREGCNNMNMNPMDDMMSGGMGVKNAMSGGGGGGNMMPPFGLSVDPNQPYKMLKLHILLEIQKTNTVMIYLYQLREIRKLQQKLQEITVGKMGCYADGGNRMGGFGGGENHMGSGGNSNFLMGMMNQSRGGG